ncbi:MAG TPA: hypothetical protein VF421_17470 [Niabella sp.]
MIYSKNIKGYYYRNDPLNAGADSILLFDENYINVVGVIYLTPDSKKLPANCWDENGIPALCLRYSSLLPLIDVLSNRDPVHIEAELEGYSVKSASIVTRGCAVINDSGAVDRPFA